MATVANQVANLSLTSSGGTTVTHTNGAGVLAADGALELPQRIGPQPDSVIDVGSEIKSLVFTPDSTGIILSCNALNVARRYTYSGGSWSFAWVSNPGANAIWQLAILDANTVIAARAAAVTAYYAIDLTTGALTTWTGPTTQRLCTVCPGGTAGKVWMAQTGGTVLSEVTYAGGAVSRSIPGLPGILGIASSNMLDGLPLIYTLHSTEVRAYKESDLSLYKTWTVSGLFLNPGSRLGALSVSLVVDIFTGKPLVLTLEGNVDAFDADAGGQKDVAVRRYWGGPDLGGPGAPNTTSTSQPQGFMAQSPDGRWEAFTVPSTDQVNVSRQCVIRNILTQTTTWSWPVPPNSTTLTAFRLPGKHGNQHGGYTVWRSGKQSYQRLRTYYKRVGVDATRVEYTPNTTLNVSLSGATAVEFSVDFYVGPGIPGGPFPWVTAPSVYYTTTTNQSPTVDAGAGKTIRLPTSSTTFTATASDFDGTISAYLWTQVSGPACTMSGTTTATLSLSALTAGDYTFRCQVTDSNGATATSDVNLTVNANAAPTVRTGLGQVLTLPDDDTTIVATASDFDGTIASYLWTQTSGPDASGSMSGTTSATLTLTDLDAGTYVFRCLVTDDAGNTAYDEAMIVVQNVAPTVSAGLGQVVILPTTTATLEATANDADGSIAWYVWTQESGPTTATLAGEDTDTLEVSDLVAGEYIFRVTVADQAGQTAQDDVLVTVLQPQGIVRAGGAMSARVGGRGRFRARLRGAE